MKKGVLVLSTILCAFVLILAAPQASAQATEEPPNPIQKLEKQTDDLLKNLNEEELKFIYATRMRDGALRAVRYIRVLVSGAVEACSEAQPDMETALKERHRKWWETLGPLLEEAENNLDKTISQQESIPEAKIRDHLKLVEEAAEYTRAKTEREYVTDREACEYLLNNMDKTELDLARQLQETLVSIPLPEPPKDEAPTEEAPAEEAPTTETDGEAL